ncbi:MAG: NADH-quinone oxidoreductase subunit L [Phycisphaeraceae bacterium]|nr:NADH-quinone oxidoreductase subunit L [Phycisphaeraceae bacterium]
MPELVLLALLVVTLPLAAWTIGFVYAFFNRRLPSWYDKLATGAVGGSLAISIYMMVAYVILGSSEGIQEAATWSMNWFTIGDVTGDVANARPFILDFDVAVDNITVIMFTVVSIVAFLVHLYSQSYMEHEDRYPRFFFYLSLFTFSMLACVCTSNLLMLFIFWELVGVCSYFLIGFFIKKRSAGDAAKKAFVTNRIGDACFMGGIFLIYSVLSEYWPAEGVLSFEKIWESVGLLGASAGPWIGHETELTIAGLLIFMGCVTKSAQFPLHIWLPDAMEGPTPVSALIHAATMVVAGVYMIVRMFPLMAGEGYLSGDYFSSPTLMVIALTGGITALFAGTIALAQTDLKKGLAYSTCSQLGYMVLAVGVGSIGAAMFHLFTHAFFKACLFLGSGSVIHSVHSQEMEDMGGLRHKMPKTHLTFLISCLAIAGTPFLSGFMSKEAILGQAAAFGVFKGAWWAWAPFALGGITAFLTAFYMFRLYWLTFWGKPGNQEKYDHAHESPWKMTVPLQVLAVLAVIAAGFATPVKPEYTGGHWFQDRVNDQTIVNNLMTRDAATVEAKAAFATQAVHMVHHHDAVETQGSVPAVVEEFHHDFHAVHYPLLFGSLVAVVFGIFGSMYFFVKKRGTDFVAKIPPLVEYRRVLQNLYFVDWFYCNRVVPTFKDAAEATLRFDQRVVDGIVNGAARLGRDLCWFAGQIDKYVVDGAVNGAGTLALACGTMFRGMVNGRIQDYVKFTAVCMGVLFLWVLATG